MKKIGTLLSIVFKDLGIEDRIKLQSMQMEWHNIFNKPLSLHTYPVDIKDKELTINVDSPAWLGQLKFFKSDILQKLHAYNISSIKFKYGRVYSRGSRDSMVQGLNVSETSNHRPLNPTEIEWLNETISTISNPDLREDIRKAIFKSLSSIKTRI